MRRILVSTVFVLTAVCVFGQTPIPQPYLSLLPGTTLTTPSDTATPYYWVRQDREVKTGFVGSVEGGFPMTRYLGVHFAYVSTSQSFTLRQYVSGLLYGTGTGSAPVNILEVGPEFIWCPTKDQEVYAQINMGHTLGSESATTTYVYPHYYTYQRTEHFRDNAWTIGLALGYRWYFSKAVGLSIQTTYHHVSGWSFSPIWAAQAGIAFRF